MQQDFVQPRYKILSQFYVGGDWGDTVPGVVRLVVVSVYWWVRESLFCMFTLGGAIGFIFFGGGCLTTCNFGGATGYSLGGGGGWNYDVGWIYGGRIGGKVGMSKRGCFTHWFN